MRRLFKASIFDRNFAGQLIMACFGMTALARFSQTYALFFILIAFRDFVAAYWLKHRNPTRYRPSLSTTLIAYCSSALPLFYFATPATIGGWPDVAKNIALIAGFTLSSFALIDLNASFGVAPANRGRVQGGVYRFLNHPMYVGYVIAEIGMAISNTRNLPLFAVSVLLYVLRARLESAALESQDPFYKWLDIKKH